MGDELLPCPFCGDRDDFNPSVSQTHGYKQPGNSAAGLVHKGWYVECDKCAGCGPHFEGGEKAKQQAIAAWNTRPPATGGE